MSSDAGIAGGRTRGSRIRGALLMVALAALVWVSVYSASFEGWVPGAGV